MAKEKKFNQKEEILIIEVGGEETIKIKAAEIIINTTLIASYARKMALKKIVSSGKKKRGHFHRELYSDDQLLYTFFNAQEEQNKTWYTYSDCSNHMTGNKNSIVILEENIKSQITLGEW